MKVYFLGLLSILILSGCGTPSPQIEPLKKKYTDKECVSSKFSNCKIDRTSKIDKIVIIKSKRVLYAFNKEKIVEEFPISLGKNGDSGPKQRIGDYKTPEGSYNVAYKQYSRNFYKSLKISYPNKKDLAIARGRGVNPGGLIMIHGQPRWNATGAADKQMLDKDWTEGCIALTNSSMDKLFYAVENGVSIDIKS